MFYRRKCIYILYTDYYILAWPDQKKIRQNLADIKAIGLEITEDGYTEDLLGFNIDKVDSKTYHLSLTKLINQIVSNLVLSKYDATQRNTIELTTNTLGTSEDTGENDQYFHY